MKHTLLVSAMLCSAAAAQEPPFLIRMIREPLRGPALGIANGYAQSGLGIPVLAALPMTGPAETIFLESHDAYSSIEAADQAVSMGRLSDRAYSTLLIHLPGLSFRPDLAAKLLPRARYLQVSTYRIRPGNGTEFGELMRYRRLAYDAINFDRPELAYQVISGASSGTYVLIAPLTSLQALDNGSVRSPAYASTLLDGGANLKKLVADIEISRDQQLLRLDPEFSYVSDEFAEISGDFWKPKYKVRR